MERSSENKIVLVTRRSRLDELIQRFNTEGQARFYVEHLGADFSDYQLEHLCYRQAEQDTIRALSRHGRVQKVDRTFLPNFVFGPDDIVVALGQDGLVANVLKYLNGQALIGVNPDPSRLEGVLLPFECKDLDRLMPSVFAHKRPTRSITMAKASLNTGEVLYAVNDLFIGPKTHASARYEIEMNGERERHSSSGIIVSTGLGSTGWLRSVMAGANGIISTASNGQSTTACVDMAWEDSYLCYTVREPWPSKTSAAQMTFGWVTTESPLTLYSQMPENGVIFSDGMEADFLQFNAGTKAEITVAEKQGCLVV